MITIVHYGLGNISAFANVYERLNIPVSIATTADDLKTADKIILPGVGSFDHAMNKLNVSGMRSTLEERVLVQRVPVLGICVGMQMLGQSSEEGVLPGLGWIDGTVIRFDVTVFKSKTQLPHMGWNTIQPVNRERLLANIDHDSRFYFLHSYYFQCRNQTDTIATTTYGIPFSSAVGHMNIYGVQFHPEKSHQWGIQLLKNFAGI
jgi:imidazole glycerol-phosphate synthase subunit HisH